jgi:hypothetical protein
MQAANLHSQDRAVKLNGESREIFDRVADLGAIESGGQNKFENSRIEIKSDRKSLTIFRIRHLLERCR